MYSYISDDVLILFNRLARIFSERDATRAHKSHTCNVADFQLFSFLFLLLSMNSIGRICIYAYISSNTRIYSISPKGFIQACVSVLLLQGGGSSQKTYIYFFFWLAPPTPPSFLIYIYICLFLLSLPWTGEQERRCSVNNDGCN